MNMSLDKSHTEFNYLVTRYLSGEMRPEERSLFLEEVGRDKEKQGALDDLQKIWDLTGKVPSLETFDLEREWAMMQEQLPGFKTRTGPAETTGRPVRSMLYYTYRIVAVFVAGLLLAFAWIYATRIAGWERVMAENEPVEVILDDGTDVLVNRHSRLRYSRSFDQTERKVFLTGEAWFDVTRDTSRPFIIDAGEAIVEVLGTSFNVNAYKQNSAVEISVESGMVALSAKQDPDKLIIIKPGSGGAYHKSQKELKLVPSFEPNTISWKTRELFFDDTPLKEVTGLINSVYGVNIVIMNRELASCPITVTFRDQSIEAILNVLETTLDLQVTRTGDEIRLDGQGCIE